MSGQFSKDMLWKREARPEESTADLERTRAELVAHLRAIAVSDEQIAEFEAFCADVRERLDHATSEDKRRYLGLLDDRGMLALVNEEKVVYITCKLGKQRVLQTPTLPLSNSQYGNSLAVTLTVRLVMEAIKHFTRVVRASVRTNGKPALDG